MNTTRCNTMLAIAGAVTAAIAGASIPTPVQAADMEKCFGISLKGHTAVFHAAHHHLSKDEVVQLRKFLETCGIDPARDFPV